MQSTTVLICVLALVCLATGQMTFTDQWTKKRATQKQEFAAPSDLESSKFECQRVGDALEQLDRLQKAQQRLTEYLNMCYNGPMEKH